MFNLRHCFVCFMLICALSSCTERIDFTVSDIEPQLVITGYVCTEPGTYAIHLSSSGNFFGKDTLKKYDNAVVSINDYQLENDPNNNGTYITKSDFCAVEGETYTLKVLLDFNLDGVEELYTSTVVAPYTVPLKNLLLQKLSNEEGSSIFPLASLIFFQDPIGPNYYGAHLYLTTARDSNSSYQKYHISNTPSKYVMNMFGSDVEDGSFIFYPAYLISRRMLHTPLDTLTVYPLDTFELELNNHSQKYFEYLKQASDASSGSNPLFMTPPGVMHGNIEGGALGAFGVYTVSRLKAVMPFAENSWTDEQMILRFGVNWREKFPKEGSQ